MTILKLKRRLNKFLRSIKLKAPAPQRKPVKKPAKPVVVAPNTSATSDSTPSAQ